MNATLGSIMSGYVRYTVQDKHSAPVTHLGGRIMWTVVTLAVMGGIYLLMWRGWRKRQAGQSDVLPLNPVPAGAFRAGADGADGAGDPAGVEGTYVSSTSEGDWLDRIAVHGLGDRSEASVHVVAEGVLIRREPFGAPDVFIPAAAIRRVSLASGMAGKYLREEGIVVVTWSHGDRTLDTGVKPRYDADRATLVASIENVSKALVSAAESTAVPAEVATTTTAAATEGHTP